MPKKSRKNAVVVAQPSPRVLAARANGRLGGLKAAANMTPEQKIARAEKGGQATKEKYGVEYFSHVRKMSKGNHNARKKKEIIVTPEMLMGGTSGTRNNNLGIR